jgi:hypothetical protein
MRTGVDEAGDLGFTNLAGSDHQAPFCFKLQEHGKEAAHH